MYNSCLVFPIFLKINKYKNNLLYNRERCRSVETRQPKYIGYSLP